MKKMNSNCAFSGMAFLLDDVVFRPFCCGEVTAIEFVPATSGTFFFHVWRSNVLKYSSEEIAVACTYIATRY